MSVNHRGESKLNLDSKKSSDMSLMNRKKLGERAIINLEFKHDQNSSSEDESFYADINMVGQDDVRDDYIEFVEDDSEDMEDLLDGIGDIMYSAEQQNSFKQIFQKFQNDPIAYAHHIYRE